MREHEGEYTIAALCRAMQVTRSGYYAWRDRPESARAIEDRALAEEIATIHAQKKQRYGTIRIGKELRSRGRRLSKKRVARLMRQLRLTPRRASKRVRTTNSRHSHPIAANLLKQNFSARQANQKWAGDITYIRTDEGWLYLAVVLDLFSRMVIGWSMSEKIDQQLTREAMLMALRTRQPGTPLIVHSDRGVQYAAGDYQQLLSDWSITPSMSAKGNCYDNAVSVE